MGSLFRFGTLAFDSRVCPARLFPSPPFPFSPLRGCLQLLVFGLMASHLFSFIELTPDFQEKAVSAGIQVPGTRAWYAMAAVVVVPPPTLVCEACLRTLPWDAFPSSVQASFLHHTLLPGANPRRSVWSCKECRAQEVVARELIHAFQNLRHNPEE